MGKRDLNVTPYNIDYDIDKKYRTVLFRPGVALQARELSEIQIALQNYAKQTWDTVYKNGTLVSGCAFNLDRTNQLAYISAGSFYWDGCIHNIDEVGVGNGVSYTGAGIEKFGFKLKEEIAGPQAVSGVDVIDSSLVDNAGSSDNYGNPGAHRLKVSFEFVNIPLDINGNIVDDGNTYFEVWTLKDGEIFSIPSGASYSILGDNLAKRTYDESGHYIVEGMKLETADSGDENTINVQIGSGKAYVKGYEVNYISSRSIEVERANNTTDLYKVDNEILNKTAGGLEDGDGMKITLNAVTNLNPGCVIEFSNGSFATIYYIDSLTCYLTEFSGSKADWDTIGTTGAVTGYWHSKAWKDLGNSAISNVLNISSKSLFPAYTLDEPFVYDNKSHFNIDIDTVITSNAIPAANNFTLPSNAKEVIGVINANDASVSYKEGAGDTDYTVSGGVLSWNVNNPTADYVVIMVVTVTPSTNEFEVNSNSEDEDFFDLTFYGDNISSVLSPVDPSTSKFDTSLISTPSIDIEYESYKSRTDSICINRYGDIIQIKGQLTHYSKNIIPPTPEDLLSIGWIKFQPNGTYDKAVINEYKLKRTTMAEIKKLIERVDDIEENQATLALEQEIKEGSLVTNLKGILADPLVDFSKTDPKNPDFHVAINVVDNELTMAINTDVREDINTTVTNSSMVHKVSDGNSGLVDRAYTLGIIDDEVELLSNPFRTGSRNLNPYGAIRIPNVTINPSKDNWTEKEVTTNPVYDYKKKEPVRFTQQVPGTGRSEVVGLKDANLKMVMSEPQVKPIRPDSRNEITTTRTRVIQIGERTSDFIRSKTVRYSGSGFTPSSAVEIFFENDRLVSTTADSTGKINGTFVIPPNRYTTGNKEVKFKEMDYSNGSTTKEAVVYYQANGIKQIYERKVEVIKQVKPPVKSVVVTPPAVRRCLNWEIKWDEPVAGAPSYKALFLDSTDGTDDMWNKIKDIPNVVHPAPGTEWYFTKTCKKWSQPPRDPLAQTFKFEKDVTLTGIKPIFTGIPSSSDAPDVFMNIGYTSNGYPDSETIFRTQYISRNEIASSLSNGVYPHIIKFDVPVFIPAGKEFFISFGSESTDYYIGISELGKRDVVTNEIVAKNGYIQGVMFSSSNTTTWTAEQTRDFTFTLYTGEFETEGTINLDTQDPIDIYGFITSVDFDLPESCSIEPYYDISGGTNPQPFSLNTETDIGQQATRLKVSLKLKGDGTNSPIIDADDLKTLILRSYDVSNNNWYVTGTVDKTPTYTSVVLIYDAYEDSNAKVDEFRFLNDSNTWDTITPDSIEETDIGNGWKQKKIIFTLASRNKFKAKFKLIGYTFRSPIIKNIRFIMK